MKDGLQMRKCKILLYSIIWIFVINSCASEVSNITPISNKKYVLEKLNNPETYVEYTHGTHSNKKCLIGSGKDCKYMYYKDLIYFVNKKECKWKTCGKAMFINGSGGLDIIDFDNKKYNFLNIYPDFFYTYGIQYFDIGGISHQVFEKRDDVNLVNIYDYSHGKNNFYYFVANINNKKTNTLIDKFLIYGSELRSRVNKDILKGYRMHEDSALDIGTSNISLHIDSFIKIYNLDNILNDFKLRHWYADRDNTNSGINGNGFLSFENKQYRIKISGNFKNAKLIGNGKLFIRKWFSDGGIHLFPQSTTKEISISSSNIKESIYKVYKDLDGQINDYIEEKVKESKDFLVHKDMRTSCQAQTKNDYNLCSLINNKDIRTSCQAQTKNDYDLCSLINNKDIRTSCQAQTKNDYNLCSLINNKDIRTSCQAQTKNDYDLCSLINDKDIRTSCQAQTKNDYDLCSLINK